MCEQKRARLDVADFIVCKSCKNSYVQYPDGLKEEILQLALNNVELFDDNKKLVGVRHKKCYTIKIYSECPFCGSEKVYDAKFTKIREEFLDEKYQTIKNKYCKKYLLLESLYNKYLKEKEEKIKKEKEEKLIREKEEKLKWRK